MSKSRSGVRRSVAEWIKVVDGFGKSGLSRSAYSRREGISPVSLERWQSKLGSSGAPGFVELKPSPEKREGWTVEIELANGVMLRVRG